MHTYCKTQRTLSRS
uniref:Uncharacterized protein n=1 Tax=Arundo donax TaxID=35708 RepID=A0A0A9A2D5_ARUDO